MKRSAGILLPITSLPSPYGVGTMGKEARKFIDFLAEAKQTYWQILPFGPTSYGDSPYQSTSTFAGNPYWIDLDLLIEKGYIKKSHVQKIQWSQREDRVDYGTLYENRFTILGEAVDNVVQKEWKAFEQFAEKEVDWLADYALYMAIKNAHGAKSWLEWPEEYRERDEEALQEFWDKHPSEILFWEVVQYLFFQQWSSLREYAKKKEIQLIGDIPIYVSLDSADTWANPELFQMDEDHVPTRVAGCPPDAYAKGGQLWGNPLYDWDKMKEDGYSWWRRRLEKLFEHFDVIRIDHFRGFESYYSIPYGDKDARRGTWVKGPGMDLFNAVKDVMREDSVIAEDLGFLTPEVIQLLKDTGFPGMKIVQFGFEGKKMNPTYLPHRYPKNCIVYTGTHDNDTALGWFSTHKEYEKRSALNYLGLKDGKEIHQAMIRAAYSSVGDVAIIPMQDILGLGSEGRINIPSTTQGNWVWRLKPGSCTSTLAKQLAKEMALFER